VPTDGKTPLMVCAPWAKGASWKLVLPKLTPWELMAVIVTIEDCVGEGFA
jgi:hypothetical protein